MEGESSLRADLYNEMRLKFYGSQRFIINIEGFEEHHLGYRGKDPPLLNPPTKSQENKILNFMKRA